MHFWYFNFNYICFILLSLKSSLNLKRIIIHFYWIVILLNLIYLFFNTFWLYCVWLFLFSLTHFSLILYFFYLLILGNWFNFIFFSFKHFILRNYVFIYMYKNVFDLIFNLL